MSFIFLGRQAATQLILLSARVGVEPGTGVGRVIGEAVLANDAHFGSVRQVEQKMAWEKP